MALWVIASITNWVWKHSRSTGTARLVLLAIAHESGQDGNAMMSIRELAQKSTLSERAAQTAVRELERLGEVCVSARAGEHRRNGYRLTAFMGAAPAPIKGAAPAPTQALMGADNAPMPEPKGAAPAPTKPDTSQVRPIKGAAPAPIEKTTMIVSSSTGIAEVQAKDVSEVTPRPDVDRLCDHLADRIADNGSPRPAITKRWRDAARLLIDKDGRTEQQVTAAINWCQNDEFWRANILSMPKLREKYDQLRLQAVRANGTRANHQAQREQLFAEARATETRQTTIAYPAGEPE